MQTANSLTPILASQQFQACGMPGASQRRFRRRLVIALGLAVLLGLTILGLGQNWLTVASLLPLLYVLPCAAMMLMCMKGMNNAPQSATASVGALAVENPKQASTEV